MTRGTECIWKMDESYHARQVKGIGTRKGAMWQGGFKKRGSCVLVLDKPWGSSRTPESLLPTMKGQADPRQPKDLQAIMWSRGLRGFPTHRPRVMNKVLSAHTAERPCNWERERWLFWQCAPA